MAQRCRARMDSPAFCLADGCGSFVRTCDIPVVSALAAAISWDSFDAADRCLDGEHHSHLHHVALAGAGAPMGFTTPMGDVAGIWMLGNHGRAYRTSQDERKRSPNDAHQVGGLKGPTIF
jgi:hypothetical protein